MQKPTNFDAPFKPITLHKLTFECVHCGRKQEVGVHDNAGITVGTVIQPYSGGGRWGRCLFCKRPGLRAVTEVQPTKRKAKGWRFLEPKSGKTEKRSASAETASDTED